MKKLILLIILTALVGCGYDSYEECILKERQKLEGNVSGPDRSAIKRYCASLRPDECSEGYDLLLEGKISDDEYMNWDYPKSCDGW